MTRGEDRRRPSRWRFVLGWGGLLGCLTVLLVGLAPAGQNAPSAVSYVQDPDFPTGGFAFQNVSWVTVSPAGTDLYVLQRGPPAVSVWTPAGQLLRAWPTQALGDPHSLRFQTRPDGSWRIWITDMAPPQSAGQGWGHCLKQFDTAGNLLGTLGVCGPNSQGSGLKPVQFDKVTDVGFDSRGNAWVTDGDLGGLNNRVLQINPSGQVLQAWSAPGNQPGAGPKQFNLPHAIDVDACDRVWVADALNHRVQVIRADGTYLQSLACFGTDGVYGVRVRRAPIPGQMQLVATSSPTSAPTAGTVQVFNVAPQCSAAVPVPAGCSPVATWSIALPGATSTAMLHAVDASSDSLSLYFATLGGVLAPQRWDRIDARQSRPPTR